MRTITLLLIIIGLTGYAAYSQTSITMAALRTAGSASPALQYTITDAGRQGLFTYDPRDITTPDNGGTVIVSGIKRFKRVYNGVIDGRWFGMIGDYNDNGGTDNAAALRAAIAAAKNNERVVVPDGQYLIKSTIVLPLTTVKKVYLEIFGHIFAQRVTAFVIEGVAQEFKAHGMIVGLNTGGDTEAGFSAFTGDGVVLRNANNCNIEVNEIKDFKNGIHMTADKNGGTMAGCQYNRVTFGVIHHNHTQIRIDISGSTTGGNWNNETYWYGGQIGRGIPAVTYGKGGWYGIVFYKDPTANGGDPMNGHVFHDVGFEGIEKALVMGNAEYNTFVGGSFEPQGSRQAIDLDPVTCVGNRFIGITSLDESQFVSGRIGINTYVGGTAMWGGTGSAKNYMGHEAISSITPNKLLIKSHKWNYTNFVVNKANDLISETGQFPTLQAMTYRINGVTRSVPFKKTFLHVTSSTAGSPLTLPANIGMVRVEATQAKVFKIDVGDLAAYGEDFLVEYLSPAFPISFVRSDNSATLIPATEFPSGGTYHCVWTNGVYKVSKIGAEHRTVTQEGPNWTVAPGTETHLVNYTYGNCITTLPAAAQWPGRTIIIKNLQAARTVQVVGVSALDENLIQGRGAMTVKSDGKTWNIINFYKRNLTY